MSMQRINIVGSSGAGKSTLGRQLSARLGVPHIELDYLYWEPNWNNVPEEELQRRIQEAIQSPTWVIDGNYSIVRYIIWPQLDTVIWLDYSLPVVMWRHLRRAMRRVLMHQECCNGNYETLRHTLSREGAWYYALKTYHQRQQQVRDSLARPEYAGLRVLHFTMPRQAQRWLRSLHESTLVNNPLRVGD